MMEKHQFKVIIVGGSIAGLTLAHCLSRAQIDYVILERRADVAPQEGASIGIMPNGARILEQLGLYSVLEDLIHPLEEAHVIYPDGFTFTSQYPRLLRERFGFPLAFLDRQKVLELLATKLPHPERLHLGTKVVSFEQTKTGVRVHTGAGLYHDGDLVVGADGVHSVTRDEMWRLSGFSPQHKRKQMLVHYACAFGISSPLPNLPAGKQITCYNHGWSILSVVGKHGRIYWFLFYKLDRNYNYMGAPRVSVEDVKERCTALSQEPFWEEITFGDLWAARERFNVTTVEEYVLQEWTWGNLICIGDSAHKIAPHTGQGANCAMEDAAALATSLEHLLRGRVWKAPSSTELEQALKSFACVRRARMDSVAYGSRMAMRCQALDGVFRRLFARYYFPYSGDMPADLASRAIADAPLVGFIPLPQRSGPGWKLFMKGAQARRSFVPAFVSVVIAVLGLVVLLHVK
ncbi:orotidine-5'-phosphate decarboxylase [Penicillium sp. CMV-2018d]|nr:orotidine-5'-phosphate decarboxylase [Penicillium sp. CMV-2018d]